MDPNLTNKMVTKTALSDVNDAYTLKYQILVNEDLRTFNGNPTFFDILDRAEGLKIDLTTLVIERASSISGPWDVVPNLEYTTESEKDGEFTVHVATTPDNINGKVYRLTYEAKIIRDSLEDKSEYSNVVEYTISGKTDSQSSSGEQEWKEVPQAERYRRFLLKL